MGSPDYGWSRSESGMTRGKRAIASRSSRSMLLRMYCFEASRNGWKSQRADVALGERRVDQAPAALACPHLGVERGEIPAAGDLAAEFRDFAAWPGSSARLSALARIASQVVELIGVGRRMDELEAAAADHHHRRNRAFGQIFADRLVVALRLRPDAGRGCVRRSTRRARPRRRRQGRRGSAADPRATRSLPRARARNGRGSRRRAARGSRPRRSSSCTRARARRASRRGR